jgi:hypothetical protein
VGTPPCKQQAKVLKLVPATETLCKSLGNKKPVNQSASDTVTGQKVVCKALKPCMNHHA